MTVITVALRRRNATSLGLAGLFAIASAVSVGCGGDDDAPPGTGGRAGGGGRGGATAGGSGDGGFGGVSEGGEGGETAIGGTAGAGGEAVIGGTAGAGGSVGGSSGRGGRGGSGPMTGGTSGEMSGGTAGEAGNGEAGEAGGGGSGNATGGSSGTGGTTADPCASVDCSGHGVCEIVNGVPDCACDSGYAQHPDDPTACDDIDECAVDNGDCHPFTTCTNSPGGHSCGACPSGYSGSGATDCVPNTCNGAPDPTCACIKVSPTGDDAQATASGGLLPFRSFQAAVDFASAHPEVASKVCIAAGDACGATVDYYGATMDMRDGVSVYGNYEATSWTRCNNSTTRLGPYALEGVLFGPTIVQDTTLDGFSVGNGGPNVSTYVAAVTADGSVGGRLENVRATASSSPNVAGVNVVNGAFFTMVETLASGGGTIESVGLRVSGATVQSDGGNYSAWGTARVEGVLLEDAPGSVIENGQLGVQTAGGAPGTALAAGARLLGDATGVEIRSNAVAANGTYYGLAGIRVEACTGAPLVTGNQVTVSKPTGAFVSGQRPTIGIDVVEDCAVIISQNSVSSAGGHGITNTAISCVGPCTLLGNNVGCDKTGQTPNGTQGDAVGVVCSGCTTISGNTIVGLLNPTGIHRSTAYTATGLWVTGPTLVEKNNISAGCPADSVGVESTNARLQNNLIVGRWSDDSCGGLTPTYATTAAGLVANSDSDVHSNWIRSNYAGTYPDATALISFGATLRNNIIGSYQHAVSGGLSVLENNAFVGDAFGLTTAAEVNAMPNAANNFFSPCSFPLVAGSLCIDSGTPTGAPADDYGGDPRDAAPDVGPDEYVNPDP